MSFKTTNSLTSKLCIKSSDNKEILKINQLPTVTKQISYKFCTCRKACTTKLFSYKEQKIIKKVDNFLSM